MKSIRILSTLVLFFMLTNAGAAEITTCILDTTIKTNPRVYFFPISVSKLRCDHIADNTAVTLAELYEQNWRLLQVVNPIEFKQKDSPAGYTPVLIYLERLERPANLNKKDVSTESSYNNDVAEDTASTNEEASDEKSGGIFGGWFKGNSQQEETESE